MPRTCNITSSQWDHAADLFELGFRNGKELAHGLGVSPQTVMRQMRKRGAKKGCRAHETVAGLEAFLDRKRRREDHAKAMAEHTAAQRRAAGLAVLESMMKAIMEADRLGDVTLAADTIEQTGAAFGFPTSRRTRRSS